MIKKLASWLGVVVFALLAVLAIYYFYNDTIYTTMEELDERVAETGSQLLCFSQDSGYYGEALSIQITKASAVPRGAQIYYTLDGNDPTLESGMLYQGEIWLPPSESASYTLYSLKVVVYYKEAYSSIYERTYIITEDATSLYGLSVVSITCDGANLYDYDIGIFVKGVSYDTYLAEDGSGNADLHGNYSQRGDDWIRQAHVTMLDGDGQVLLDQGIGLGVAGNTSALNDIKSLRLVADETYDATADKFEICLENQGTDTLLYSFVEAYNSIRLRSGSQDMYDTNIRSSIASRLGQEAGFDGVSSTNRCIVFLNGTFYGIFDMQQIYSSSYLADRFGLEEKEAIEVYESSEPGILAQEGMEELSALFWSDLDQEENREALEALVDMDSYLLCYALEILWNNTDFVNNNFKMWRYAGETVEGNAYTDGRYRFLIYDFDMIYNTDERQVHFAGSNGDLFEQIMQNAVRNEPCTLYNVLQSAYYRDRFITLVSDLLTTTFATEHVTEVVVEEFQRIQDANDAFNGVANRLSLQENALLLLDAVEARPTEMADNFATYFGLEETYTSQLTTAAGVAVSFSNQTLYQEDSYTGEYYTGVSRQLTATPYPGYTFAGWQVNGALLSGVTLQIGFDASDPDTLLLQSLDAEGELLEEVTLSLTKEGLTIYAMATPATTGCLVIDELYAKGMDDYFVLYNAGTEEILLSDY